MSSSARVSSAQEEAASLDEATQLRTASVHDIHARPIKIDQQDQFTHCVSKSESIIK